MDYNLDEIIDSTIQIPLIQQLYTKKFTHDHLRLTNPLQRVRNIQRIIRQDRTNSSLKANTQVLTKSFIYKDLFSTSKDTLNLTNHKIYIPYQIRKPQTSMSIRRKKNNHSESAQNVTLNKFQTKNIYKISLFNQRQKQLKQNRNQVVEQSYQIITNHEDKKQYINKQKRQRQKIIENHKYSALFNDMLTIRRTIFIRQSKKKLNKTIQPIHYSTDKKYIKNNKIKQFKVVTQNVKKQDEITQLKPWAFTEYQYF